MKRAERPIFRAVVPPVVPRKASILIRQTGKATSVFAVTTDGVEFEIEGVTRVMWQHTRENVTSPVIVLDDESVRISVRK